MEDAQAVARAPSRRAGHADAFDALLMAAGLEAHDALAMSEQVLTPDAAERTLGLLMERPITPGTFPPHLAAAHLLREVLEGGEVTRAQLLRRVERLGGVAVLRPDGYLAWVLSGRTQQRVARVEWRSGAFRAHGFELGRFYDGRTGVFRLLDAELREANGFPLADVHQDADYVSRTLDGAEEAFVELALAVGQLVSTHPGETLAALRNLPSGVVALILSSPAFLERFRHMTRGEQVKAISKLVTSLIATWGTASAASRTFHGAMSGLNGSVPGLSLSADGALILESVVVPAGRTAAVLSGGPGAAVILQRTRTAVTGAGPGRGPGQWGPSKEAMSPRARRYQEQISGRSADEAYWVGGMSTQAGGVRFDGFRDGVLLEAKGPGYAKFFDDLDPKEWFRYSGARGLVEQADRQSRKVRGSGLSIRWHVAEKRAADAIRKLLEEAQVKGVEVVHTLAL